MTTQTTDTFDTIARLPKVELHVHLEGCMSAQLALELAVKNNIDLPYDSVEQIEAAKDFGFPALQNFLAFHYTILSVVRTANDVYRIAAAFFQNEIDNNVRHVEVYVGFQDFLDNGIPLDGLVEALTRAKLEAVDAGLSVGYIFGVNRGLNPRDACTRLQLLDAYPGFLLAVGICSEETDNPPELFTEFFAMAVERGYRVTAHCDCDQVNAVEHIRQCVEDLPVERIDHGMDILSAPHLIEQAIERNIHFVMTPTWRPSDPEPRRTRESLEMAHRGLSVSFGSDDPEEFSSSYANTMYTGLIEDGPYDLETVVMFIRAGIENCWAPQALKNELLTELERVVRKQVV